MFLFLHSIIAAKLKDAMLPGNIILSNKIVLHSIPTICNIKNETAIYFIINLKISQMV
jgi:hypothetical protein